MRFVVYLKAFLLGFIYRKSEADLFTVKTAFGCKNGKKHTQLCKSKEVALALLLEKAVVFNVVKKADVCQENLIIKETEDSIFVRAKYVLPANISFLVTDPSVQIPEAVKPVIPEPESADPVPETEIKPTPKVPGKKKAVLQEPVEIIYSETIPETQTAEKPKKGNGNGKKKS